MIEYLVPMGAIWRRGAHAVVGFLSALSVLGSVYGDSA